jgi:hypothetical protein
LVIFLDNNYKLGNLFSKFKMITTIVTTLFNTFIFGSSTLTPEQRWRAAGDRLNSGFMTEHWFLFTAAAVGIILSVLLLVVNRKRIAQQKRTNSQLFDKYAGQNGLSEQESQLLLGIARRTGLQQPEAIFTMSSAFERGASIVVEESIARKQPVEQIERLKAQFFFLREKLGFRGRPASSMGFATKPKRLNSRQIPVGKKIYMVRRTSRDSDTIESTIMENNDTELVVKVTKPIKIVFGESWYARYYFGASVWEFDTSVVSCNGDVLVLNHSDEMRFVNRRRFLRVPVQQQAFIAHFPFTRTPVADGRKSMKSFRMYRSSAGNSGSAWGPPEFVPAVVTELAGPGLCIEAPLELKVDDRVLVMLELKEGEGRESAPEGKGSKKVISKIVEDMGVVRHIKAIKNGFSIAVELIGLSDLDVNELIRATNAASLRAGCGGRDVPASDSAKKGIMETVAAKGV